MCADKSKPAATSLQSWLATLTSMIMSNFPTQQMEFSEDLHGLPCLSLVNGRARACVSRQGAQVLSWCGTDGRERLYLSPQTGGMKRNAHHGMPVQPIRGGIPVCFPQFSDRGSLVKHGFVRNKPWTYEPEEQLAGGSRKNTALLHINDDAETCAMWPHNFRAEIQVSLQENRLTTALSVINTGNEAWQFTAALHTYLRVSDIRNTQLLRLGGERYQDATAANAEAVQLENELHIAHEVDRVYLSPPKTLHLLENGERALQIEQQGFDDTVVWNPGPIKAAALHDFPDNDWLHMLCVEAACIEKPVVLQPGQRWSGSQVLSVIQA